MGWQTVGSVHFRRHSRALQPFLIQVRRVFCPADVAVPGWSKSRGSAGGRLRRRRHGSVWRRELPLILHRFEPADAVHDLLISVGKLTMFRPPRCYPFACRSHPRGWRTFQGERQRYRELHFCRRKGHEVPTGMREPKPSPSPLAQLVTPQWGQRRSCPHIWFSVRSNRKVVLFQWLCCAFTRLLTNSTPAVLEWFESLWFVVFTATIPLSSDQTTPTCLKSSSSSRMEWPTNRLKAKMRAANGWPTSFVKCRSVVSADDWISRKHLLLEIIHLFYCDGWISLTKAFLKKHIWQRILGELYSLVFFQLSPQPNIKITAGREKYFVWTGCWIIKTHFVLRQLLSCIAKAQ